MTTVLHYYDFTKEDEIAGGVVDRSGALNGGTFSGDAVYKLIAGIGRVLDFPIGGGGGLVTVADSATLDIATTITVGARVVKSTAVAAPILSKATAYKLEFAGTDLIPSFSVFTGSSWYTVTSAIAITADSAVYIEGSYDGATISIRINGALQGSVAHTGAIDVGSADVLIGSDGTAADFEGYIQELIVKDTANDLAAHKTDVLRGTRDMSNQFIELLEIAIPDDPLYLSTYFEPIDITVTA